MITALLKDDATILSEYFVFELELLSILLQPMICHKQTLS